MELYDEEEAVNLISHEIGAVKKSSKIFWVFPPLEIYLERRRLMKIIRKSIKKTGNVHSILSFYNKAAAWFFVSLAGLFKGVESTYVLYEIFFREKSIFYFVIMVITTFILSTLYIVYRVRKNYILEYLLTNTERKEEIAERLIK